MSTTTTRQADPTSVIAAHDPLALAQALIRCPSVTPDDAGAQAVLADALRRIGFTVTSLPFGEAGSVTPNLFARIGTGAPHVCFAGHTDVVPAGDASWQDDPFGGMVRDNVLYGRGACDMKGAIAAFVAASATWLDRGKGALSGSISLLVTGDEEGPARDGTVRVLDWMAANRQIPDFCLVGEPTNPGVLGEMIKIGRRGSLNAHIVVPGIQGHVAYPHRADNPVHRLLALLAELTTRPLDGGTDHFEPSSLQVTSIDVGNKATNVIPAQAEARVNIRFNDQHTGASLTAMLHEACERQAPEARLDIRVSGEAFRTEPGPLVEALVTAIEARTGRRPKLDTGGGTSDARFIAHHCPVAEFGLVGETMHKADECVPVDDLQALSGIYLDLLGRLLDGRARPGAER
ncbi:succinyl-diaminopimelate desuccinylase [Lichenicola sp.]|uniref:succinyl-diaminopimelate desuccinylase n=1 Tax=Lichenicola sp. TaxID=2804529 RepID=UPI003B00AD7F